MIITKLTLHNFGVYAGNNVFEFNSSKPIVLIGGMNGRGKTTFLEAVLLALYGANSFAYSESKYHSYGQYLKAHVNMADATLETYIELEFKLERESDEKYLVKRSWAGGGQRTREKIRVKKDGEYSEFLTENWAMFIENILPSGLSNFFFFDGEKIAELAVESTSTHMKESIKALLGISVLDTLENDLSRIVNRTSKKSENQVALKEMDVLKEKKNQADVALQLMDDQIEECRAHLEQTRKRLEKARIEYTSRGGDIVAQRQELFNQRTTLAAQLQLDSENLAALAAGELPLLLVKKLMKNIRRQSEKEHDSKVLGYAVEKIQTLFESYTQGIDRNTDSVQQFVSYVEDKAAEESTEIIYDLSDQSLYQLKKLLESGLEKNKGRMLHLMADYNKKQAEVDKIDNYLSVDIDEKALAKLYKEIKTLEQQIIDDEVKLEGYERTRVTLNGEVIRATSEYHRYVESVLSNLELHDDSDRVLKYSHYAISILREYKLRLQKQKIGVLADTMTACYKKLANKKNLINRIEMDADTLDLIYLNEENREVPKDTLSAGEKQLMVISLLWSLAICSKKKLPVIIDTPLSRMDSNHRVSLITTYFPKASDQTIILSTDSEIDEHYYNIMKDNVGDEFTLIYNDELRCSVIKKGYFVGDVNDNQAN